MLERLLNQSAAPMLERTAAFHSARHSVLAENIVNLSTPGYRQKDLDIDAFRSRLAEQLDSGALGGNSPEVVEPGQTLMFHDGNDRNVEQLISDQAKNAMQHNLAVELLRKQYALFDLALRDRVG